MTELQIPSIAESRAAVAGLRPRTQLFIDGEFRDAVAGERFGTVNPATGEELAQVAKGGPADVEAAVAADRRAPQTTGAGPASNPATASGSSSAGQT